MLPQLMTPERVMSAVPGKNTSSLRLLAVKLARNCFFGDDILALSSPSGKGGKGNLQKLDAGGLNHIKGIIRQRVRDKINLKFEAIWSYCLNSISKVCQNLRTGRLARKRF
jgi:hypothetical protein